MSEDLAVRLAADETVEEEERRTSYLELFFDLVFVFAITQVTALVAADASAAGFAKSALLLGLVWWAWSAYAWMTDAIDVELARHRLLVIAGMASAFFMALAVPDAYQGDGLWFAVPYFLVRLVNIAVFAVSTWSDPVIGPNMRRLLPWFLVAPVVALGGGFAEGEARIALWAASLAIDVVGTLTVRGWRLSASHFAERYALFVIIALGESIVAIGVGVAGAERDSLFALSVCVAFAGVAALWWSYFDFTQLAAERALRFARDAQRGPIARDVFTLFHYPLVLGIILYAVAAKKTLEHPDEPLSTAGRWALGLGLASYLSTFVLARYRVVRLVAWERLGGIAAAVALSALLTGVDAVWLLAVGVAIVVAVTALETVRLRDVRARVRAG